MKRESRRQARAAREEAEAHTSKQKEAIKSAVKEARTDGFPTDVEEKEAYFMNEVARGEALCQDGEHCSTSLNGRDALSSAATVCLWEDIH